jgi:hypothetical protein
MKALACQLPSTHGLPLSRWSIAEVTLTPNDFPSLDALRDRILGFQRYYERIAQPFEWKFTRRDLEVLLNKLNTRPTTYAYVAA